ncbi:MAG: carbohydrate ABC transporter permease [Blautia sp.]|nr:carbohydrate ABC transporter permease [Blautia sp.]MDY3998164.1 carbohydrate ABC transporter permease [Blautia sp.]
MIHSRKNKVIRILFYAVILVFILVQIYPIFWVICSSLKTADEMIYTPQYSLPSGIYLGNYISALTISAIPRYFLNSTVVAILTLLGIVILGCPVAFVISKVRIKYANALMGFFLFGMMIPIFSCLVPMFQIYNALKLRNTYWALVIPQVGFGLPMCIYLYTGFFKFLPDSLLEAAVIDGAGMGTVFARIVVPMAKNTTMTVLTYNFVFVWNEFTYANTFISSSDMKTLPIGLNDFVGQFGRVDWGSTFAAIVISILPTLVVYFILNKNIIEGMAAGAVKS